MDILKDIKNILRNDKEHFLKVTVDWTGVHIYLEYDPQKSFNEDFIIPIYYNVLDEFAYIPDSEYRELIKESDYGIVLDQIKTIKAIMNYLESHKEEIAELCNEYDFEYRKNGKEE